jgi:hypothetical protein
MRGIEPMGNRNEEYGSEYDAERALEHGDSWAIVADRKSAILADTWEDSKRNWCRVAT